MKKFDQLNEKHKKEIDQILLNDKYEKNFMKYINEVPDMFYNAENIFKNMTVSFKMKNIKEAITFFKKYNEFSENLYKIRGYGSIYSKSMLKEKGTTKEFKIKNNYYYKINKFSIKYDQDEKFIFYLKLGDLYYHIIIEIEDHMYYYDFAYCGKTQNSKIERCYLNLKSNQESIFNSSIKLWSGSENISDYILFNK